MECAGLNTASICMSVIVLPQLTVNKSTVAQQLEKLILLAQILLKIH